MTTQVNEATAAQIHAARPNQSTWLAANAGSGKTRVLTDRVARLLRGGVNPQNILCLTYTKAAATEMQNRLFARLGEWAMKPDDALRADLAELGEDGPITPADLAHARTLFARALETPGGLRIQTIHSFCASILRRFPMEAGVSPQFVEIEDSDAAHLRSDIFEQLAADPDQSDLLRKMLAHLSDAKLPDFLAEITRHRTEFDATVTDAQIMAAFDLAGPVTVGDLWDDIFGHDTGFINHLANQLMTHGTKTYQDHAQELFLHDWTTPSWAKFDMLCNRFLYTRVDKDKGRDIGDPKSGNYPQANHKGVRSNLADLLPKIETFMDRLAAAKAKQMSHLAAQRTGDMHRFANTFLSAYAAAKSARGWLDFDDLILKTRDLLRAPGLAQWVLFRLDGGIDHILVDEAQDTSPLQWDVIEALAAEFTAGEGVHGDKSRTMFVVGDKKQSIYSFQGADPAGFDRMADRFADKLANVGDTLTRAQLAFSFRSASAVLQAVDAVIPPQSDDARHRAFKSELPGRVDIWPAIPTADKAEETHWADPLDQMAPENPKRQLAQKIAAHIGHMLRNQTAIPDGKDGFRPVRPDDFLILVRGRTSGLFDQIIRACKSHNLPIAGADRMVLGAELAVQDLTALMRFLVTPEDDYALACVLKSPLIGWDEAQLYNLAQGRGAQYLWQALRADKVGFAAELALLNDLRDQADFMRPYDLLERVLIKHHGRQKLLGRLSVEAEDGINALLAKALHFERSNIPSLSGFIDWLDGDEVQIKRQTDTSGGLIRVMTVHGAKGLEAPIVILPDTGGKAEQIKDQILSHSQTGLPLWKGPADAGHAPAIKSALDQARTLQQAEKDRLLYVAMTRAEKWLIVAAAGDVKDRWFEKIQTGVQTLGAAEHMHPTGQGLRLQNGDWPDHADAPDTQDAAVQTANLPDWANQPAPAIDKSPSHLRPSDLGGAKALPGAMGEDSDTAMAYGTLIHLLLEHLPTVPDHKRAQMAQSILSAQTNAVDDRTATAMIGEAMHCLSDPALAALWAPDALCEVTLTAVLPALDGHRIRGAIDRLIVTPGHILAIDYKTNRTLPKTANECPLGILRQQAVYWAALRQIYPDHTVEMGVLWTAQPLWMPLPQDLLADVLSQIMTDPTGVN